MEEKAEETRIMAPAKGICSIIGMDLVTALGAGLDTVWGEVIAATCALRPLARFPQGRYRSDYAGEIHQETYAPLARECPSGDSSLAYTLAFHTTKKALDAASFDAHSLSHHRVGLVLATTKGDLPEFEHLVSDDTAACLGRFQPFVLARDLALDLGLNGPALAVSGACASGLLAIIQAARLIARGACDFAVAVGVDVLSDFVLSGFSSVAALDPKPCRPYDASRSGLSLGEGAGALVLASLAEASHRELSRVLGWGVANDARHITAPSPTANGLIQALHQALAASGLESREVHYVNGHGTGTLYNDAMEAKAIYRVFGEPTPPVSSFKGYFGHTLGAAGIVEAILTVMALRQKTIPASLNFHQLGVEEPIAVAPRHLPEPGLAHALTIKSGFGGINAVIALSAAGGS